MNAFLQNPIKVKILTPSAEVKQTIVYLGDVPANVLKDCEKRAEKPLREIYGKQYKSILGYEGKYPDHLKNIIFTTDSMYPDDNFEDARNKIQISSGIMSYAQHIFYFRNSIITTTYSVRIRGIDVNINIFKKQLKTFESIPMDLRYTDISAEIMPLDVFNTLTTVMIDDNTLYVVDLADYIRPDNIKQLRDNFQLNLVYNCFIQKFYPRLTLTAFKQYLAGDNLNILYPELSRETIILENIYGVEKEVLDRIYRSSDAIEVFAKKNITTFITKATGYILFQSTILNIRNIFDILSLDDKIIGAIAYIYKSGRNYIVQKTTVSMGAINFPHSYIYKKDLVLAFSHNDTIIFVNVRNNGKITASANWSEITVKTIEEATNDLVASINYIITKIKAMKHYATITGTITTIGKSNPIIMSLVETHISLKKTLDNLQFNLFLKKMEVLQESQILLTKKSKATSDKNTYLLHKGAYNFQRSLITQILSRMDISIDNLYAYLTDQTISSKWLQNYSGRDMTISHRTISVDLIINSIGICEFNTSYHILSGVLYDIVKNTKFVSPNINQSTAFYKARRLKQEDPELYDLKRFGSNVVYARLCQKSKQPIIYTEEEIGNLDVKQRAKLIKYWNFTTEKPAYYDCPNKKYPNMSFITNKHPKKYCLPCCAKKVETKNIKCLTNHTFVSEIKSYRHVIDFGKLLEPDRLSHLPEALKRLYYNKATNGIYIIGVEQRYNNAYAGVLYSVAKLLEIDVADIIKKISVVLSNNNLFNTLLGGLINMYFKNNDELRVVFNNIFVLSRDTFYNFDWNELLLELIGIAYSLKFLLFKADDAVKLIQIKNPSVKPAETFILINYKKNTYPLVEMNRSIIDKLNKETISATNACFGVKFEKTYDNYAIIAQYINKMGLCYAHILGVSGNNIYLPVDYLELKDKIPAIYDVLDVSKLELSALITFLDTFKIAVKSAYIHDNKIVAILSNLGLHYINPVANTTNYEVVSIKYNPIDVHKTILASTAPDLSKHDKLLGGALYVNYQYKLFIMEFANFVDKERNTTLRENIYELINSADFTKDILPLRKQLKLLLTEHNTDLLIILNTINYFYKRGQHKKHLIDKITNIVFNFDKITINKLLGMNYDEKLTTLRSLCPKFAVEGNVDVKEFPNIYIACEEMPADYCDNGKLIVKDMNMLIKYLADDMTNKLKSQYFLTNIWIDNYVDFFTFIARPNEKIQIFQ
jgi:hypothetical protein